MRFLNLKKILCSGIVICIVTIWYYVVKLRDLVDPVNTPVSLKPRLTSAAAYDSSVTAAAVVSSSQTKRYVDIWSKAAIGTYFWEHVFESTVQQQSEAWSYGEVNLDNITLRFFTGPGIAPQSIPAESSNIVLILNGREASKISVARRWLDYIVQQTSHFSNVAVVLLGNEQCNNSWIMAYMIKSGGPVKAAFVVYDSPDVDNDLFYQWPLGVATYRSFPAVSSPLHELRSPRKYTCNFIGTVYENSTRELLLDVLRQSGLVASGRCFVKTRTQWLPLETKQSMGDYVKVLHNSDLTLNPAGKNVECYRVYEAMAVGSVPVIEDTTVTALCGTAVDNNHRQVLRLLKEHDAPVIYVSEWRQLAAVLQREQQMTSADIIARRIKVVNWYRKFRRKMRDSFVRVIRQKFFDS